MIAVQIDSTKDPYGYFDPRKQSIVDHRIEISLIEEIFPAGQRRFVGCLHHWMCDESGTSRVLCGEIQDVTTAT